MSFVLVRQDQNHMATTFELTISCAKDRRRSAESALAECHALIRVLERELSEFIPESPVYRLNRSQPFEKFDAPDSLLELLRRSEVLFRDTSGAFNPAIKSKTGGEAFGIAWDERARQVWRVSADAHLGFGAIGKGYALDRARVILAREGFTDYLLNAGGSSLVISGFSAPETPWSWGLSWKKDEEGRNLGIRLRHASGNLIAIGVSGSHEKGAHILAPGGKPVEGPLVPRCAMIAHSSAASADALSTALFVHYGHSGLGSMEESAWPEWLPRIGAPAALIDAEEIPLWNAPFVKLWGALAGCAAAAMLFLPHAAIAAGEEEAVDLGAMGADAFTPYLFDRSSWLIALPLLMLAFVILHLKRTQPVRRPKKTALRQGE